jgi:hypothetical protein
LEIKNYVHTLATLGASRLLSLNGRDWTGSVAVRHAEKPRQPGAALNLAARRATFPEVRSDNIYHGGTARNQAIGR